jgi:Glycosyl hydrolase family 67 N-terminus/Glycosyl hydrolase family 10
MLFADRIFSSPHIWKIHISFLKTNCMFTIVPVSSCENKLLVHYFFITLLIVMTYLASYKGFLLSFFMVILLFHISASADDGYQLWLKYHRIDDKNLLQKYQQIISSVAITGDSKTCHIVQDELKNSLPKLLNNLVPFEKTIKNGTLLIGTPRNSLLIKKMNASEQLRKLGQEGYLIKSTKINGKMCIAIAAQKDIGLLYGTYHLLRLIQTHQQLENIDIVSQPKIQYRLLDHWDNFDSSADINVRADLQKELNPYVDGLPVEVQKKLADRYAELFSMLLAHPGKIGRVTLWGVYDKTSWLNNWPVRGRTSYPLLFDRNYQPKQAFFAVLKTVEAKK